MPDEPKDIVKEAFEKAAKTGHAEISIRNVPRVDEKPVEITRTEATDEELKASEELVERLEEAEKEEEETAS